MTDEMMVSVRARVDAVLTRLPAWVVGFLLPSLWGACWSLAALWLIRSGDAGLWFVVGAFGGMNAARAESALRDRMERRLFGRPLR